MLGSRQFVVGEVKQRVSSEIGFVNVNDGGMTVSVSIYIGKIFRCFKVCNGCKSDCGLVVGVYGVFDG